MALTTAVNVGKIIELDEDIDVTPFIELASLLLNEIYPVPRTYSDAYAEQLERWLAAHFYAVRDPRTTRESVESISEHYEGRTALGLDFTRYGQQVKVIDVLGDLVDALDPESKKKITGVLWHIGGGDVRGVAEEVLPP